MQHVRGLRALCCSINLKTWNLISVVKTCFWQDGLNQFQPLFEPPVAETCQPCVKRCCMNCTNQLYNKIGGQFSERLLVWQPIGIFLYSTVTILVCFMLCWRIYNMMIMQSTWHLGRRQYYGRSKWQSQAVWTTMVWCVHCSVVYWTDVLKGSIYRSSVISPSQKLVVKANEVRALAIDFSGML